jgi:hypothetical protein
MTRANDRARTEAEWVWPTVAIGMLWALGLLLSWVWLVSWVGLVAAGVIVAVMAVRAKQQGWLAALWGGGYAFCATAFAFWIAVLAFFRVY